MLLALFASEAMNTTDLTPGTPYDPGTGSSAMSGGETFAQNFSYQTGGGPCAGSYVVRQGDTLSQIARTCGVTLDMLLAANPSITNPNLIRPGQVLSIFYMATAVPTISLPDTGGKSGGAPAPTAAPVQETTPDTGKRVGDMVVVDVQNFPPLTLVKVEMGVENGKLEFIKSPQTGTDGSLRVEVMVPLNAKLGEKWVVVVTSTADPNLVVRSPVFTILP